ncbi:MAG: DedA family protein [Deltaproteobacteria bacterium]|nr:DedA family protein [Deltaproteobacteria bacterium]
MAEYFHGLVRAWFLFVENWGYLGVFLLMALESSIVPVPSEVVMPPAAFWASQGKMDFWGVVLAGTAGSYFGSIVSYGISRAVGTPIIKKYGKYFLLSAAKLEMTEAWIRKYGNAGIFTARLLPVVRHLISIPAGIFEMPVLPFSIMTIAGAFLWCLVLSWFGREVIGNNPELLSSPEMLIAVCKAKLRWFIGAVVVLAAAYAFVVYQKRKVR